MSGGRGSNRRGASISARVSLLLLAAPGVKSVNLGSMRRDAFRWTRLPSADRA